jgi:predicted DNA-binding transcriptional regulator AlpA
MMALTKEGASCPPPDMMHRCSEVIMSNQTLSPEQAASYLGFHPSTLERWRRLRIGPKFIKVGGCRIAYMQRHLDEYLESRIRTPMLEGQK